jgi:hypothetical protein
MRIAQRVYTGDGADSPGAVVPHHKSDSVLFTHAPVIHRIEPVERCAALPLIHRERRGARRGASRAGVGGIIRDDFNPRAEDGNICALLLTVAYLRR